MLHPSMVEELARSYQAEKLQEAKEIGLLKQAAGSLGKLSTGFRSGRFGRLTTSRKGQGKQNFGHSSLQTAEK